MTHNEKEDRQNRYDRRRDHTPKIADDIPRRKTPYKREFIDYNEYLEEDDEWHDGNYSVFKD